MRVLKAIAVVHVRNQRAQTLSFCFSIALAVAGLLTGSGSRYGAAITRWLSLGRVLPGGDGALGRAVPAGRRNSSGDV